MAERLVIVGGGAGGTMLANIVDHTRFEVVLVSAAATHLFQPGLLYVAFKNAGGRGLVRRERDLLHRRVRFVDDRVTLVDFSGREVHTVGGTTISYDHVVLATGMTADRGDIPGLAEVNDRFGDYHSDLAQARKLWANLDAFSGGTVALGQSSPIIKCPPSPLEGVLLIDALLRKRGLRERTRLVFFTPYPRPYPAEPMSRIVAPVLEERGIEVLTFFDVDRIDTAERTIHSIEGDRITYDLPIVIPSFVGADIAYEPPGVVDQSRFLVTDRLTLRVKGTDSAFAIGDATNVPTSKAGVGAHLEAKLVAAELAGAGGTFDGRTNCPFDFGDGTATFVSGSYDAPVRSLAPTRFRRLMKMGFGRLYWFSLRGWLEPVFDVYFGATEPTGRRPSTA